MPTTRKHGSTIAVATLGLLLGGALAGCSVSRDDSPKSTASSGHSPSPSPTATSPTASQTTSSTPSPTPSATSSTPSTAASPEQALLRAADLPPLSRSSPWTEKRTAVPGPTSFGACQQFDALSIGAMNVVERTFTTKAGDAAGQQVAEFPDAQNTVRATKVLEHWHQDCRTTIRGSNVQVGPISAVPVAHGKGWWYLATWTRNGTPHVHAFGMTWSGNRMVMLTMDHNGQARVYPAGQDPMELAVKAASVRLGG